MTTRLKIISSAILLLIVINYVAFYYVQRPVAEPSPTFTFLSYSNSPSGQEYALVAVSNIDSCAHTFFENFVAFDSRCQMGRSVKSSLANQTINPGESYTASFEVPAHTNQWCVVGFSMRHTLIERIRPTSNTFGRWLFPDKKFEGAVESGWFPK
jgi:hypothetical protein